MATRESLRDALMVRLEKDLEDLEKPNTALYDLIRKLLQDMRDDADKLPDVPVIGQAPFAIAQ